jgi:hypothetical protein
VDPLVLALVAIGGIFLGIWLGRLQTRSEDRRWRHEKKLHSYTNYLAEIVNYEMTMIRWAGRHLQSQGEADLETSIARIGYAREAVRLVGAKNVVDAVTKISDQATSGLTSVKEAHEMGLEPPDTYRGTSLLEFVAAVRADLGFRD